MYRFRLRVILILIFGGFVMVSTRLFYLQVIRGDHYRDYTENVRVRRHATEAGRGRMLAAGGELLGFDAPSFNVAFVPRGLPEWRSLWRPVRELYRLGRREKIVSVRDVSVLVSRGGGGELVVSFGMAARFLRREGTGLVEKEEHGSAQVVVPEPAAEVVRKVAAASGKAPTELLQAYFEGLALVGRGWRRLGDPCLVARDVGFRAAAEIETHQDGYPGVRVVASARRSYPNEELACHVLGYMQPVSAVEYRRWKDSYAGSPAKRFLPDDVIGRAGVERAFDVMLRPARGEQVVEVDAARHRQRVLEETPAVPGRDVQLTLDVDVQRAAEEALRSQVGSAVVMEAATGRILALASAPGYNANELPDHTPDPNDRLAPMLNRAIQGQYPLGSVFKLLLAIGALEEGKAFREVTCTGHYRGRSCANHRVPLVVSFHDAIKRSCNVYFFRTGHEMLGVEGIARWGARFGFGQCTGVNLPGEKPGLMPTAAWKRRRYGERWYSGDTLNLAIGQGYFLATPLQVARFVAAVANGGTLVRPRLVDRLVGPPGGTRRPGDEAEAARLGLSPGRLAQVHRAMRGVCHEMGGTARRAWQGWIEEQGYAVAGKTSTADCWLRGQRSNIGWFVCFAPVGDPRVVVVVALEHEGQHLGGGDVAAPLARHVLARLPERYLDGVRGRELRDQFRATLALTRHTAARREANSGWAH